MLHKRIHRIRFELEYLFLAVLILFVAVVAPRRDPRRGDWQIGERVGLAQQNPVPEPDILMIMEMVVLADHHPEVLFVFPIRHRRLHLRRASASYLAQALSLETCPAPCPHNIDRREEEAARKPKRGARPVPK